MLIPHHPVASTNPFNLAVTIYAIGACVVNGPQTSRPLYCLCAFVHASVATGFAGQLNLEYCPADSDSVSRDTALT